MSGEDMRIGRHKYTTERIFQYIENTLFSCDEYFQLSAKKKKKICNNLNERIKCFFSFIIYNEKLSFNLRFKDDETTIK